jgi:DNA-binding transcriptional regulator GbsR (MarR family)
MLSNRHKQILSFIQNCIQSGKPLSIATIGEGVGMAHSEVSKCLMDLENGGFIDRGIERGKRVRSMRVLKVA